MTISEAHSFCTAIAQIIPTLLIALFLVDRKSPSDSYLKISVERLEKAHQKYDTEEQEILAETSAALAASKLAREHLLTEIQGFDRTLRLNLSKRQRRNARIGRATAALELRNEQDAARELTDIIIRLAEDRSGLAKQQIRMSAAARKAQNRHLFAITVGIIAGFYAESLSLLGVGMESAANLTVAVQTAAMAAMFLVGILSLIAIGRLFLSDGSTDRLFETYMKLAWLVVAATILPATLVIFEMRVD